MNKRVLRLFFFVIATILILTFITSCSSKSSEKKEPDTEESNVQSVQVRDITFSIPNEFKLDESISDDDLKYYKVFDDEGKLQQMLYVSYDGSEIGNILEPESAESFCNGVTENEMDYTGYNTIQIDDKLSAIRFSYKHDNKGDIYKNDAIAFSNSDGNLYSMILFTLNDQYVDLDEIIESIDYSFDVWQQKYDLNLQVYFEENVFLDIYEVEIYVDDEKIGTIAQGNTVEKTIQLTEGKHDLIFYKSGSHDITGSTEIDMTEAKAFSCSIKSHSEDIDINNQLEETPEEYEKRIKKEKKQREKEEAAARKAEKKAKAAEKRAKKKENAYDKLSTEEKHAYKSAQNYLDFKGFSKAGLIDQLSSEYGDNYPRKVAEKAVNFMEKYDKVNWTEQAKRAAQSYLDSGMSFSKAGLVQQLESPYGEQFTHEQATKAVDAVYK